MNLQFKLKDILEVDLYYGFYDIFVLGGFDVQVNDDFFIEILDLKTNEAILLREKNLKVRDYKNGKRAVKFFSFQVTDKSKYRISVHNYEDLTVFYSMIGANPFSIFNLLKKLYGVKRKQIQLDEVEILIS
ncbi:hypothetical protein [Flavobacterium bizetiae]|uniref:hypothetical protein n=2 Tax=Flavobacterium bizetiae TaxID=2704140 RepID=UPI00174AB676|nr:hypothetical protein [Flavobacterium bizetiae]UTN06483.1 hypothetical protein L0669_11375 [Flavobacterium bizetiae]CAD5343411.1 hypothetical protein FLA105535_03409 [Flavobacterium bizetiae]CAD5349404.1 hypothetical protein FLA105534_03388 [Flavobacterium bizetiae]